MKVFVIGTDKAENHGAIDTALRKSGHALINDVCSLAGLPDKLAEMQPRPDVVIVRADVAPRDKEVEMLAALTRWPLVVLLPPSRFGRRSDLEALPQVRGVLSIPPFDFSRLDALCSAPVATQPCESQPVDRAADKIGTPVDVVSAGQTASQNNLPRGAGPNTPVVKVTTNYRQVRLGFFGQRGGVGVSTTALKVAQAIAARGQRVALFDLAGRGDLHVMLGREPQTQVMVVGSLSLFLGLPSEDIVTGFNAVVLDGGRHVGQFNAQWVEIRKPLTDQAIGRLLDVEKPEPARSLGIGRLVSIEVTD
jgi:hypothetical protein